MSSVPVVTVFLTRDDFCRRASESGVGSSHDTCVPSFSDINNVTTFDADICL
jgi:hypothetical protein